MSAPPEPAPPAAARSVPSLALLAAPVVTLAAALVAPHVVTGPGAAAALTFGGGSLVALVPLALAAHAGRAARPALLLALAAGLAVALAAFVGGLAAALLVNAGLVAFAHAAGGSIGARVAHPGHLLPACAVAAAADLASLLTPGGPTRAIVESERALGLLAVGFPVPGTVALAPVLGLGDLLFVALVLGVAAAHGLSKWRVLALALCGVAVAGALSAALEGAVPALVPIAAAIALGLPAARRLRPEDRRTAQAAIAIAGAVIAGVALRAWLVGG